jgi:hypothetical protein
MLRTLAIAIIPVLLAATPSAAVTSQEKMETCKVGAESQQLQGAKRSAFIKKCMAGEITSRRAQKRGETGTEKVAELTARLPPSGCRPLQRLTSNRAQLTAAKHFDRRDAIDPLAVEMRIRSSTPVIGRPSSRTMVSRLINPASVAGHAARAR